MFGKLTLDAFKHEASQNMAVIWDAVSRHWHYRTITYFKRWKWLWNEWLTSVDPKRIGIMYIIVALMMFFKGFADALMMRLQQALSVGDSHGFISAGHFQEVFSAHGTTMIFFVGMGVVFGLIESDYPFANWGQGCGLSFFKCPWFLAFCRRQHVDTYLACYWKFFSSRMACLSSPFRHRIQS